MGKNPARLDCAKPAELRAALDLPEVAGLRFIRLKGESFDLDAVRLVARCERLGALEGFSLSIAPVGDGVISELAGPLSRVRSLGLTSCGITSDGAAMLAGSGPSTLELLDLGNDSRIRNLIDDRGALALARSTRFRALRTLTLSGNPIGDAGALALVTSSDLATLRELNVFFTSVTREGAGACQAAKRPYFALRDDFHTPEVDWTKG